jgi:hypothetical protein
VGPRAVLDVVKKRKIHSPRRESNPRTPIVQAVAQRRLGGRKENKAGKNEQEMKKERKNNEKMIEKIGRHKK